MVHKHLANSFTILNGCFGLLQLFFLIEGHISYALIAFFLAIICDGVDGYVARLLDQSSSFGKELDSLADMVTFGVGGACWIQLVATTIPFPLRLLLSFFYLYHALRRLAHFNATNQKEHYIGLPVTSAAFLTVMSLYLHHLYSVHASVLVMSIVIYASLMNLPFKTFKCHYVDRLVRTLVKEVRSEGEHD
ncbi:CDP-diacylglycerol--serine O-phosphatidyltransferase [Pelagirhabdus alkalitolerans]|uniref:CDP-diacylglycerol--serine O-phosphatidyltransferase n=1 Tax=Pelagirhabdus alkalitolerans TaxID=1612202 RepID=A0A1G6GPT8_9BACI|nr:CDP-alcohol phosphatidyltransferase family protein [Pelagirhabdus alkalitolerans]SDB83968.1 CDP-diacylglycerol--serine O-phosphatidyltransferase [Pelagirhabdus alkalitolerans]